MKGGGNRSGSLVLAGRVALVTGASSGIGREIASRLAELGCRVVATGRNAAALEELGRRHPSALLRSVVADLSETESAGRLLDYLAAAGLAVDLLVNSAGFGDIGDFLDADLEKQLRMIRVNIEATVFLTRNLAPPMVERGGGHILNVASTAAFAPGPLMAVYYASKAFVLSFSLALREELRPLGVTVSTLCPGPTRTGFDLAAGAKGSGRPMMAAHAVARAAVAEMLSGKRLIVPGLANKISVFAARALPSMAVARYLHRFNRAK